MNLYDILIDSATTGLALQTKDGAMPSGSNGLYGDEETPVRNTAHWLILFLKAAEVSGQDKFNQAARYAADYLCSSSARPMNAAFWHRKNPHKDFCNGLIGQAWTIEALVAAFGIFTEDKFLEIAEEVFLAHLFDERQSLWRRLNVDGSYLDYDWTFNHQLWFAAAGAMLIKHSQSEAIKSRVAAFMDALVRHINIYPDGLIYHPLLSKIGKKQRVYNFLNTMKRRFKPDKELREKAVGYHAFNLYAFGLLKQYYPNHSFWRHYKFQAAIAYSLQSHYKRQLEDNRYGYPYNPAGIEMAYVAAVFELQSVEEQAGWLDEQMRRCYNFSKKLMCDNSQDENTSAARLYEATRLANLPILTIK